LATMLAFVVGSSGQFPISVDYRVWTAGFAAIVVLALAVGLLPALRAQRLKIVDALAGR
ncbi:MAG TPA: ABC transporter permease, partial [Rhodanobacteraceae bacterium]|nr:ABC transporter permease [Rhodanobacteraceae bacterium]